MSYPIWIYPEWSNPDDFDGPEDYAAACAEAELSYDLCRAAEVETARESGDSGS